MDNNDRTGLKPAAKIILGAALVLCPVLTIIARLRSYFGEEKRP